MINKGHTITRKVQVELDKYIPKYPKEHQSDLRMTYYIHRMHYLGKKAVEKKTATEVLDKCLLELKERHPDYIPAYDPAIRGIEN